MLTERSFCESLVQDFSWLEPLLTCIAFGFWTFFFAKSITARMFMKRRSGADTALIQYYNIIYVLLLIWCVASCLRNADEISEGEAKQTTANRSSPSG